MPISKAFSEIKFFLLHFDYTCETCSHGIVAAITITLNSPSICVAPDLQGGNEIDRTARFSDR